MSRLRGKVGPHFRPAPALRKLNQHLFSRPIFFANVHICPPPLQANALMRPLSRWLSLSSIRSRPSYRGSNSSRTLVTLAIETSCDDTGVAVLSRTKKTGTHLLFNERISSDNRKFRGIHPLTAAQGHGAALGPLIQRALAALPEASASGRTRVCYDADGTPRQIPDFVSVTRGPGMRSNLSIGLDTAKGLAIAWGVPLVGVHHMQAHALTPRLARALGMSMGETKKIRTTGPDFPFLSLLVSGGHTQLVHSTSLTTHRIMATTGDIAVGNLLDQTARDILPAEVLEASDHVMYGRLLEAFAFPSASLSSYDAVFTPAARRSDEMEAAPSGYGWTVPLPYRQSRKLAFSFSGIYTDVNRIAAARPDMDVAERRALAQHTMMSAFKHLAGRLCLALEDCPDLRQARTLVIAGGVACNRFLMYILRRTLEARGFSVGVSDVEEEDGDGLEIVAPPIDLCTDNAAMIAWTGMEMFEAGYQSDLALLSIGKWPLDPEQGPGILGVDGWVKRD